MTFYTIPARAASRRRLSGPDRRHRAEFARAAVIAEFGGHGRALDQADFVEWRTESELVAGETSDTKVDAGLDDEIPF